MTARIWDFPPDLSRNGPKATSGEFCRKYFNSIPAKDLQSVKLPKIGQNGKTYWPNLFRHDILVGTDKQCYHSRAFWVFLDFRCELC